MTAGALLVLANIWATVRIGTWRESRPEERIPWIIIVWAMPVVGLATWILKLLKIRRSRISRPAEETSSSVDE